MAYAGWFVPAPDRMLDTRGETAVYLLFAYARLKSILRKAQEEKGVDIDSLLTRAPLAIEHPVRSRVGPAGVTSWSAMGSCTVVLWGGRCVILLCSS